MSILKGILHHWNKTNSAYDTIHPETEVSQITDWNQGIVNTLASTALGTLVNTLTSDSLLATMIQKVLTATGVKYSMRQNGYICFGSLFGGLIIQWVTTQSNKTTILPIAFLSKKFLTIASPTASSWIYENASVITDYSLSSVTVYCASENQAGVIEKKIYVIAIGI